MQVKNGRNKENEMYQNFKFLLYYAPLCSSYLDFRSMYMYTRMHVYE